LSFAVYVTPPNETEVHGFLVPANDPIKATDCTGHDLSLSPKDLYCVHFGGNKVILSKGEAVSAFSVAGRHVLVFRASEQGLGISGEIFSKNGETAFLSDNEFWLNSNMTFRSEHPDRSTLIVRDNSGVENLSIRYSNKHLVNFTGHFYFPSMAEIIISDVSVDVISSKLRPSFDSICAEGSLTLFAVLADGNVSIFSRPPPGH